MKPCVVLCCLIGLLLSGCSQPEEKARTREMLAKFERARELCVGAQYEEAIETWTDLIENYQDLAIPENVYYQYAQRATCRMALGQFEAALADCMEASTLCPPADTNWVVRLQYMEATLFEQLGEIQQALASYRKTVALRADYRDAAQKVKLLETRR